MFCNQVELERESVVERHQFSMVLETIWSPIPRYDTIWLPTDAMTSALPDNSPEQLSIHQIFHTNSVTVWIGGIVVRSRTSDSEVPPGPLSSNNLEQVIYTRGAQANSAFHPSVNSWRRPRLRLCPEKSDRKGERDGWVMACCIHHIVYQGPRAEKKF